MNQQSFGSGLKPFLYIDCGWKSILMLAIECRIKATVSG